MLSRTAEGLYWMARYVERAENVVRLVEAGRRLDGLPETEAGETAGNEWEAILIAAGCRETFPGDPAEATAPEAIHHLILDPANSSSVVTCLSMARMNARAQRIGITADVWSAINLSWRKVRALNRGSLSERQLADTLDLLRERTMLVRGAIEGTQLRNEGYHFICLGQMIERADATARLIDVKYHVLLPEDRETGSGYDHLQWSHLLRSAGALSAYRWVYRKPVHYRDVVDFLLLNGRSPRSLRFCYDGICRDLQFLREKLGIDLPSLREAEAFQDDLTSSEPAAILGGGLHEYLTDAIIRTNNMAVSIANDFGFGPVAQSQQQSPSG